MSLWDAQNQFLAQKVPIWWNNQHQIAPSAMLFFLFMSWRFGDGVAVPTKVWSVPALDPESLFFVLSWWMRPRWGKMQVHTFCQKTYCNAFVCSMLKGPNTLCHKGCIRVVSIIHVERVLQLSFVLAWLWTSKHCCCCDTIAWTLVHFQHSEICLGTKTDISIEILALSTSWRKTCNQFGLYFSCWQARTFEHSAKLSKEKMKYRKQINY